MASVIFIIKSIDIIVQICSVVILLGMVMLYIILGSVHHNTFVTKCFCYRSDEIILFFLTNFSLSFVGLLEP